MTTLAQATSMTFLPATSQSGRRSPFMLDLAQNKDKGSISLNFMDSATLKDLWTNALDAWGFVAPYVEQYAASLSDELISIEVGETLEDTVMRSLKIRIGHRRGVRQAAAMARRAGSTRADMTEDDEGGDPLEPSTAHPLITVDPADRCPTPIGSHGGSKSSLDLDVTITNPINQDIDGWNEMDRKNSKGVRWRALSGGCDTFGEFFAKVSATRQQLKFPKNFDRAFLDNKPMPFQDKDVVSTLIVMRIPDLTNESGTTVATITNRLVVMFSPKHRILLTYHRCDVDPLERLALEWEDGVHDASNIYQLVDAVNRCVMKVFRHGVRQLQEVSDALEEESDLSAMVEGLTLVQKKAAVYKRCLAASREVLAEVGEERGGLEDHISVICEGAEAYESMIDEVSENAMGSINMHTALDGFRSSRNTQASTYISLVCQPITLATGWYGMNFVNMPDLTYANSYYVFIGCAGALVLTTLLFIRHQVANSS